MAPVRLIHLHSEDNVAIACVDLAAGDPLEVAGRSLTSRQDILAGHKLALVDIPAGHSVVKYGEVIGRATQSIRAGDWVHLHNLASTLAEREVRS